MSYQNSQRGAGYYDRPLQRLVRELDVPSTGGKEYTYTDSGSTYWGHVEQTGSTEVDLNGRLATKTAATIALRGWVTVSTLDRLSDSQFSEVYVISSIARGNDELLLECWKL